MSGHEFVGIPDGWHEIAFFARLVNAGICKYESLVAAPADGGLTVAQVFDLQRMLDWRDYCEMAATERRRRDAGHDR